MKSVMWFQILFIIVFGASLAACSPTEDLDGTSWAMESYRDSGGAIVDILPDTIVSANFQGDQVWGNVTCNDYSGSYQTTGKKIKIGPLATTMRMCVGPEGIMEQETAFLHALEAAAEYKINGDVLELVDAQGEKVLVFNRTQSE